MINKIQISKITEEIKELFNLSDIKELFILDQSPEFWIYDGRILTEKLWIFDNRILSEHSQSTIDINYSNLEKYTDKENLKNIRKRQEQAYCMKTLIEFNYRKQKLITGIKNAINPKYINDIIKTENKLIKSEIQKNEAEIQNIKQGISVFHKIKGWQFRDILEHYLKMQKTGWNEPYYGLNEMGCLSKHHALLYYSEWFFKNYTINKTLPTKTTIVSKKDNERSSTLIYGLDLNMDEDKKINILENLQSVGLIEKNNPKEAWLALTGGDQVEKDHKYSKIDWLKSYTLLHLFFEQLIVKSNNQFDETSRHLIIDSFFLKDGKPISRKQSVSRLHELDQVKEPKDIRLLEMIF